MNLKQKVMKKITLFTLLVSIFTLFSSVKSFSQEVVFSEGFEDITILTSMGWDMLNLSNPPGTTDWLDGISGGVFPAHEGVNFIAANFNNTSNVGTISNWLITPVIEVGDDFELKFYTRAADQSFPDRLEFRLSTEGAGSTLPSNESDVGDFTELLLTINPDLNSGVYPEEWTEFTVTVSGVGVPTDSRIAFRYHVTNSGPNGSNGNYIGIDAFEVVSPLVSIEDNTITGFNYYYSSQTQSLNISATETFQSIAIFNVLGQEVVAKNLSSNSETINMSSMSKGIYIAHVTTVNGDTATFKVVKR